MSVTGVAVMNVFKVAIFSMMECLVVMIRQTLNDIDFLPMKARDCYISSYCIPTD